MTTTSGIEWRTPQVRQPHYEPGDILPSRVTSQGAVVVNEIIVCRDYGDCILAGMDLTSKYAELWHALSFAEDDVELYLRAKDDTLHLRANTPRDAITVVKIIGLPGWEVWASAGPYRYSLALTLCCPRNET